MFHLRPFFESEGLRRAFGIPVQAVHSRVAGESPALRRFAAKIARTMNDQRAGGIPVERSAFVTEHVPLLVAVLRVRVGRGSPEQAPVAVAWTNAPIADVGVAHPDERIVVIAEIHDPGGGE